MGNATLFMHGRALNQLQDLMKSMYNQEIYIEFRFLGYTQALEVYHRLILDHDNPQKV
jgi:hypothetical protein